ncbi:MAG: glycosyltransferase [Halothece sp.]
MSKVAIFLSDLDGGGAERVMLNLARGLIQDNIDVDLILVRKEGPYLEQIPSKINVIDLQKKSLLRSLPSLVSYLKQKRPQVLLSALEDTNIIAIWAKLLARVSVPLIVTVHNNLSQESQNATNFKRKYVPKILPWFYPWADAVVAVSQGVANDLVNLGLRSDNIKIIYNPIVTPELVEKGQQPLEDSWFLSKDMPVILGVGRLTKQKDFTTLVQAFAKVRQFKNVRLMILGEGEERSSLESLIEELGLINDVCLPGFVENPYIYMAKADVLVLSSAWEGFGNVLVEAMAVGTPVVSTDCDSGPAEILENGKYGKLVPVEDSEEMAKAIASTLENPPTSEFLKQRATKFSLNTILMQYQQLLKHS